MTSLLFVAALLVAFSNGANDNAKGVAPLVGAGVAGLRAALRWGNAMTALGALASIYVALRVNGDLIGAFSGGGLIPREVRVGEAYHAAIALGAAATVLVATRLGIPVSTTHALTGALLGVGAVLVGPRHLAWATLGRRFAAPLLVSPALAAVAAFALYPALRRALAWRGEQSPPETRGVDVGAERSGVALYASSAAVSFARGLNDTPKLVGVLSTSAALSLAPSMLALSGAMLLGGLMFARRVGETMATRITRMDTDQALTSSLVTAALVLTASRSGLPVSTTHVSVGALIGIGVATGSAQWRTIGTIAAAWVTTLPLAATLGALAYVALR